MWSPSDQMMELTLDISRFISRLQQGQLIRPQPHWNGCIKKIYKLHKQMWRQVQKLSNNFEGKCWFTWTVEELGQFKSLRWKSFIPSLPSSSSLENIRSISWEKKFSVTFNLSNLTLYLIKFYSINVFKVLTNPEDLDISKWRKVRK